MPTATAQLSTSNAHQQLIQPSRRSLVFDTGATQPPHPISRIWIMPQPPNRTLIDGRIPSHNRDSTPADIDELIVSGIPSEIMPPPQHEGAVPALEAFLGRYPKLAGYTAMSPKGVYPDGQGGTVHLEYPSSHTSYHERTAAALAHTTHDHRSIAMNHRRA